MTAIPIGSIVIDIGEVPQWFIAVAAAFVVYKVWRAESKISEVREDVSKVRHETNSMRSALELASRAEGRLAGRQEMREETAAAEIVAKETIRTDAVADAETAAKVYAANPDASSTSPVAITVTAAEAIPHERN